MIFNINNEHDTGWISITPIRGEWSYLEYRRMGDLVTIRGHATEFTWNGSPECKIVSLPEDILPKDPDKINILRWFNTSGRNIVKGGISSTGDLLIVGFYSLVDGEYPSGHETTLDINFQYII